MKNLSTLLSAIFVMALIFSISSPQSLAQVPEMSPAQARQLLLSYLQAPDTSLTTTPALYISLRGHTEYLFHGNKGITGGDSGGDYHIDAATQEKTIDYTGGTTQVSANDLPATQLQQIATNFVSQHFPGYYPGMFQVYAPSVDTPNDANIYSVDFTEQSASGADLPIQCSVTLTEDIGQIIGYSETNIPVTINTVPAVSQSQAIQDGQSWIYQNISTDPLAGQTWSQIGEDPVRFYVFVDSAMNQTLLYRVAYRSMIITIDAQTGAVLQTDDYLGGGPSYHSGPSSVPKKRELFYEMQFVKSTSNGLAHSAIFTEGQTFIWNNYLKIAGINVVKKANGVDLIKGARHIHLKIVKEATADNHVAWMRKDGAYIPLATIQTLTNAFVKHAAIREVVINLPHPRQANM